MSGPLITVRNLSKSYGDTLVLERVNLDVEAETFCTIVGASGCGKSTFLRMLLSQERPTGGTIKIAGEPIADEPTPDRGIVFQRYSVFSHLTVEGNLLLAAEFEGAPFTGRLAGKARASALEAIEGTLERIGLSSARKRYPSQLSGGMQQRLAIAQALLKRELGMTIFMVTHDIHEAFKLGTRMLVFDKMRHDPHQPDAFGATITYDLSLKDDNTNAPEADELFPVRPDQTRGPLT